MNPKKQNYPSYEARQALILSAWRGDNPIISRLLIKAAEIAEDRRAKAMG